MDRQSKPRQDAVWDYDLESWVVPFRCACCNKCTMRLTGPYKYKCVHMGPYMGYVEIKE